MADPHAMRQAVIRGIVDGYGVEDIALANGWDAERVRFHLRQITAIGAMPGVIKARRLRQIADVAKSRGAR